MSPFVEVIVAMTLALSLGTFFWRFIKGPSFFSKVVAIDFLTSWTLVALILWSLAKESAWSLQVVPSLTFLGFLSVVALAQFMVRNKS